MTKRIINCLLLIFLFFLPLQTRWAYAPGFLNGGFWEYGTGCFYATEILLWLIVILFFIDQSRSQEFWRRIKNRESKFKKKSYFFTFLLFYFFTLTLWHSFDFWISFQYLQRLLGLVCLGIILITHGRQNGVERFWLALWLSGLGQGIFAVYQFFTQKAPHIFGLGLAPHYGGQLGDFVVETADGRWLRAYGSFGSPNSLGIFLAIALVVGLLVYLSANKKYQPLITAGQLIIIAGLFFSFSRGAWLATGVGLISLILIVYNSYRDRLKQLARQFFYYFFLILILFLIFSQLFFSRLNLSNRLESRSINERISQITVSCQLSAKNYLFGVGPGAFTLALYRQNPSKPASAYQPAHNIYLLILAEGGVAGFLLYGYFIILLVKKIWRDNKFF